MHFRTALLDGRDAVGLLDGVRDRAVAHHAPVDEHVLGTSNRPLLAERRHDTPHGDAGRVFDHRHQVRPVAVDLIEAFLKRAGRRRLDHPTRAVAKQEPDVPVAERQLGDEPRDLGRLGGVGLQELPPAGRLKNRSATSTSVPSGRADLARPTPAAPPSMRISVPEQVAARARSQTETRHRGNRRQRLTAESQRPDGRQIVGGPDLAAWRGARGPARRPRASCRRRRLRPQ